MMVFKTYREAHYEYFKEEASALWEPFFDVYNCEILKPLVYGFVKSKSQYTQFLLSSEAWVVKGGTTIFCFLFLYSLNSVTQTIDPQEQARVGSKPSRTNSLTLEFLNQDWMPL